MRILKSFGVVAACSAIAGFSAMTPLATAIAAERDRSMVIEEVIVTSRRTAESLQDVPISVTAFRQADIERIAPRTLRDFDGLAPNLFIGMNTAGPSAGAIFIRGLGYADIEKTQSSAVGVIVDGLFQPSSTGQLIDTFDIEQLEINRGPQGVLFGKNTTGGTIVATRVKPTTERFGFNVSAQAGRFDERIYKARVNVPLSDTAALKIGGIKRDSDGYYDNLTRGGSAGDIDYGAYTISLLWEPTDRFSAQLTYDNIRDRGDIPPQDPRYNGQNPFKNEADYAEFQRLDVESWGLQLEWVTDYGVLTSITGWVPSSDKVGQDFDGSTRAQPTAPLAQLHTLRDQDYDTFTQEIRFAGDVNDQVSYQVGAFYMTTDLDFKQGTNQVLQFPRTVWNARGVPLGADCLIFGTFAGFTPNPALGDNFCQLGPLYSGQISKEETESLGIFASVNWQVTDKFEVSVGARYIDDQKEFATAFYDAAPVADDPLAPPTTVVGEPNLIVPKSKDSWNDTIFKLTASYAIDYGTIYASFSQGYRSGGFSVRGIDPLFNTYDPETVDAWEVGSKTDFLDGRLRVNMAAFYTVLQDLQFSTVLTDQRPGSPGTNTIINNAGGDIDIWGLEAEMTALLSDQFTLMLSGGVQKNSSDRFEISSERTIYNQATQTACNPIENPEFFASTPNTCPGVTAGGGELARTPQWNWAGTLIYGQEVGPGYLQASGTVRGQDSFVIFGGATSTPGNTEREGGYTLVDARVSYEWPLDQEGRNVVLSLVGKNLTDVEYREQTLWLGGPNGGFQGWAAPRTYAVEVVWNN